MSSTWESEVFLFAEATQTVPGFTRIVWNASNALWQARSAAEEAKEYEATHKTKGKAYAEIMRRSQSQSASFSSFVDSACFILESLDSSCSRDSIDRAINIHDVVLGEVSLLTESFSFRELYSRANGWV